MLLRLPLLLSLAIVLGAAPISYRFSGTGSGSVDGNPFSDEFFVIRLDADTDDITNVPSLGDVPGLLNLNGFVTLPSFGTFQLVEPQFIFADSGNIGFGSFLNGNSIRVASGVLGGYALLPVGPINLGENFELYQFVNVATNLGPLTFSTMSDVTFQAVGSSEVPEPATLLLIAPALWWLRRRRQP